MSRNPTDHLFERIYELEPSPKQAIAFGVGVTVLGLLVSYNKLPDWAIRIFFALILVGAAYLIPKYLSWIASIIIAHIRELKEITVITDEVRIWAVRNEMASRYQEAMRQIASLSSDQIRVLLGMPSPAEIEFSPERLDFLILAQSGKRVPLVSIKDIIDTWSRLIQQDNTFAEKLPPINLWTDGHQRAFIRDVYHELALLHFIQTFGEQGTWSRGNVSALLTPGITPAMILSWCRADVLFGINYTAFEVQQEPDDETQAN